MRRPLQPTSGRRRPLQPTFGRALLFLVLLLSIHASLAAASDVADPRALLRQSIDFYVAGRYVDAVKILRPLVDSRVLRDRADQLEALRTYGICLFLSGAKPGAERAFRDLLRAAPAARLDRSFVRPEVVRFFDGVRRRYLLEIREVERRGSRSVVPNLLPPWGQFRNGHRVKGYVLLGGELAFGITSVATAALLWTWKDDTGQFGDREHLFQPLSIVNYITFFLSVAVYSYGVVDGMYHHYAASPLTQDRQVGFLCPNCKPFVGVPQQ